MLQRELQFLNNNLLPSYLVELGLREDKPIDRLLVIELGTLQSQFTLLEGSVGDKTSLILLGLESVGFFSNLHL